MTRRLWKLCGPAILLAAFVVAMVCGDLWAWREQA